MRARVPTFAFVSTRDGDYAIFQMNANGGAEHRVTDEAGNTEVLFFQVEPAWSPDGTKIAFSSRRNENFDIYVMNADGTGTKRLTSTRTTTPIRPGLRRGSGSRLPVVATSTP